MFIERGETNVDSVVLSSLPIYYFLLFSIPFTVVESIEKTMRKFLWSGEAQENDPHLV